MATAVQLKEQAMPAPSRPDLAELNRMIARFAPAEIRADHRVQEVYLGGTE